MMPDDNSDKSEPQTVPDASPGALAEVLILNDDVTTMEFVVEILEQVFDRDCEGAIRIMLEVHHEGSGVCGIYPLDIAEAKVREVLEGGNGAAKALLDPLDEVETEEGLEAAASGS